MKQAISYVRFSSTQQGKGTSTQRQKDMVQEWLTKHPDYVASNLSASDEGRSGYTGEHLKHGLGSIKEAINLGKIKAGDVLLVESLDRLGRLEPMEMIQLVGDILRNGVEIVTLEDQQTYTNESANNNLLFMLAGKTQGAHQYSKNLGRRIASAYESKRKAARAGAKIKKSSPWWIDSKNMRLKEPQASAVKRAIELYLSGEGTRSVLIKLRAEYPLLLEKAHPSRLVRWFRSRALLGDWVTNGETISGVYDPLIELSTYNEIQSALERRTLKPGPEEKYLLSGLIMCKACSKAFHFRRQKPKPTKLAPIGSAAYDAKPKIVYANCKSYLQSGLCKNNSTWPYEVLNFIFNREAPDLLLQIAESRALSNKDKNLNELHEHLKDLERQRIKANKIAFVDEGEQSLDRLISIKAKITDAEHQIKSLVHLINIETSPDVIFTMVGMVDFNGASDELSKATQGELDQQSKLNDLELRELLKKYRFKILIDGKTATCSSEGKGLYRLLQRKQKHSCYVVEYSEPEVKTLDDAGEIIDYEASQLIYYAVGRKEIRASAGSLGELDQQLALEVA